MAVGCLIKWEREGGHGGRKDVVETWLLSTESDTISSLA